MLFAAEALVDVAACRRQRRSVCARQTVVGRVMGGRSVFEDRRMDVSEGHLSDGRHILRGTVAQPWIAAVPGAGAVHGYYGRAILIELPLCRFSADKMSSAG